MTSDLIVVLCVGILLILLNALLSKILFKKQTFIFEEPLYYVPPVASAIPPMVKFMLTFKVPRSVRTNESSEVSMEYFQGVIYWAIEGLNSFLYEKLDLLPKPLPNNLRGLLFGFSTKKVKDVLSTDFTAKLTSSKFSTAPIDKIIFKKGTKTPCKWRWYVHCSDSGRYELVFELNDAFKEIKDPRLTAPIIFEVEVRESGGLSQKVVKSLKFGFSLLGSTLIILASAFLALPQFQTFVSKLLHSFFPGIFN